MDIELHNGDCLETMAGMKTITDYSKFRCPFDHIEKDCGHELQGPEGYEDTYGVWCACGFRGPVFCLGPKELRLLNK